MLEMSEIFEPELPFTPAQLRSFFGSPLWADFNEVLAERVELLRADLELAQLPEELKKLTADGWTPRELDCYTKGRLRELRFVQAYEEQTRERASSNGPGNDD